ncbi:MAG: hypothetical protein AB7S26_39805 [Sandaracinaceae bacterium]
MRTPHPGWLLVAAAMLAASAPFASVAHAIRVAERVSVFTSSAYYNLHGPGTGHAQGERHTSRVTLRSIGTGVRIEDAGERTEYRSAARTGYTETIERWHHEWTGRRTVSADGARLTLALRSSTCTREVRRDGATESSGRCRRARALTLVCSVDAEHAGMACTPASPRASAAPMTPAPWIFLDAGGCLAREGGTPMTGAPTFSACTDAVE